MKRNFILANRRFFIYFLILGVAIIFTIKLFYIQIIKNQLIIIVDQEIKKANFYIMILLEK